MAACDDAHEDGAVPHSSATFELDCDATAATWADDPLAPRCVRCGGMPRPDLV